jgi:hypothetical protein
MVPLPQLACPGWCVAQDHGGEPGPWPVHYGRERRWGYMVVHLTQSALWPYASVTVASTRNGDELANALLAIDEAVSVAHLLCVLGHAQLGRLILETVRMAGIVP